jgi:multisubunit Na+/H+ antiporter MnhE subunit
VSRYLLAIVLLTLTYALVLASFDPWDLLLGAGLSVALLLAFRSFVFGEGPARRSDLPGRLVAFVPFALAVVRDIIVGTWEVTLVTLHLRRLVSPGIVAIPIGERTPTGVAVSALATTLSPGTFLVDVDEKRGVMLIHSINAGDPDAVREAHQEFYRRYQKRVFP